MKPEQLSKELRQHAGEFLSQRRAIVGLELLSMASLGLIAAWQIGAIKKLPHPRAPRFDAPKVNGSAEAYSYWGIPDAFVGLASYAVTAGLAAAGPPQRWRDRPWMPLALAAKLVIDGAQASRLTYHSWTRYRAFSPWSLIAAAATLAALPLAIPEARAALRRV